MFAAVRGKCRTFLFEYRGLFTGFGMSGKDKETMEKVSSMYEQRSAIDKEIAALFRQRNELTQEIMARTVRAEERMSIQERIEDALAHTPSVFPQQATVACQGVEGANSQIAAERLFSCGNLMFFKNFEGVFSAIEKGLCDYGVLPIENSTAGSVIHVYDLMMKYRFHIAKSVRVKVDHNLLAKPGTKKSQIKEIFSHEQAIMQCSEYLKRFGNVKVTAVENTAVAARMVSESGRDDVAALCTRACCELYHLECIEKSVQDNSNNYTRFICISKNLQIFPGASRTSIMAVLPHKPGSLFATLKKFADLGYNLAKIESRPIPERDFEFMFYFDFETSVYSEDFVSLIGDLKATCEAFEYLGSYSEVL